MSRGSRCDLVVIGGGTTGLVASRAAVSVALSIRACLAGQRVQFATATHFSAWGEIFGDDMAATAMIDRLIHHSEILSLKGDSYRLRGKDLDARIGAKTTEIA